MLFRLLCLYGGSLILLSGCLSGTLTTPDPVATDASAPSVSAITDNPSFEIPMTVVAPEVMVTEDAELVGPEQDDPSLTLDAETQADNEVLQGADQSPPEEIGETIAYAQPEYDFPVMENEKVRYFIDYFSGDARKTFTLWLQRSTRYLPMMREVFAEAGLPRDLAYLAMVESGFNDKAYSWAHAVGPWQFIESTGRRFGLQNNWWQDERRDPYKATQAAAGYLQSLYDQFDGDWYLAVASYNAGPGKIRNAIRKYNTRDFWELSRGSYLRKETKNYLPKLLAAILIAKEPEKYGFTELEYQEPLDYDTAVLPSSTDIEVIASLAGVDYDVIKQLNPELKRWCSPPGVKDYEVRLPAGSGDDFAAKYAALPADERANYVRHKIKSGDTLLAIAKRYGVRVDDIKRLNRIKNPRALQLGSNLIVPLNPDFNRRAVTELKDDYKRSRRTTYTVRSGDSLWTIARKFDVTEKQLRVWNRLGWTNVIRPGQRLIVSGKTAPLKTAARKTSATGPLTKVVYKVRPGDTLWGIGRQFAVETHQIRDWNNLTDEHVLMPGEHLTLMVRGGTSS